MEKIYSRRKIKVYKINKIKLILFLIPALFIIYFFYFLKMGYPVFIASCENAAFSKVTNIVTREIRNVMEEYSYNDLISIEKDNSGKIVFLGANTIKINEITAKITQNIQNDIDKQERTKVFINMGTLTGISKFCFIGPKFEIELETAGDAMVNLNSEFIYSGINQTIHKIYVDIDAFIKIITPLGAFEKDIISKVLLTESIIVGDVPESYYDLENLKPEEVLKIKE